ncbi:MAG: D-sedoheptulose 7-phosphate isomerase [Planctomycetota bacterium]
MQETRVTEQIAESVRVKQAVAQLLAPQIVDAAKRIAGALARGNKLLLAGNGGSAADAQHIAAELVGRYLKERSAWPAISLATDTSALTALTNDYGIDAVFRRQVEALGVKGDVLIAISTSGSSPNILAACEEARRKGITVIGLTGERGAKLEAASDLCLKVPSAETPRIQESHIMIGHIVCDLIETELTS